MNINEDNVIGVEEWAEELELLLWSEGVVYYKVVETFKRGVCTYILRGLTVGYENIVCWCSDLDNILLEGNHALKLFLKDSPIIYKDATKFILEFSDGNIILDYWFD